MENGIMRRAKRLFAENGRGSLWHSIIDLTMENCPIEAFTNQVGGHTFELQKQGMLHQGNCILKQLQDMGRGYYY